MAAAAKEKEDAAAERAAEKTKKEADFKIRKEEEAELEAIKKEEDVQK
jgi:hypothetical protein